MRTCLQRPLGESRELIVDGSYDDDLGIHREQLVQRCARSGIVRLGKALRSAPIQVLTRNQIIIGGKRGRSLCPDRSTADDCHAKWAHAYSFAYAPSNSKSNASSDAPAAAIACLVSSGRGAYTSRTPPPPAPTSLPPITPLRRASM